MQANQSLPPRNGGSRKKRSTSHAERDGDKRSLTEPAVDDFAARQATNEKHQAETSAQLELAAFRRNLA